MGLQIMCKRYPANLGFCGDVTKEKPLDRTNHQSQKGSLQTEGRVSPILGSGKNCPQHEKPCTKLTCGGACSLLLRCRPDCRRSDWDVVTFAVPIFIVHFVVCARLSESERRQEIALGGHAELWREFRKPLSKALSWSISSLNARQ
jgi:hypothetical protein